jgi:hypothetical protein
VQAREELRRRGGVVEKSRKEKPGNGLGERHNSCFCQEKKPSPTF